jgi:hypothetical protein
MGLPLVDSQTPFRKCLKLRSILGRGSFCSQTPRPQTHDAPLAAG